MIIEETNLSVAWGKAFLEALRANEISPLVVVINDLDNAEPPEIPNIRNALDATLKTHKGLSCDKVANTIFPYSLWNPKVSRDKLYERYLEIFSRVQKNRRNQHGVYFHRLICFGYDRRKKNGKNQLPLFCDENKKKEVNQLEHIIETWERGNHRRTALQASVFDPYKDHSHSRRRGFPCLQQVTFAKTGRDGLVVTGFYATQYIFERAYGNYLGLCRLGHFMACEMNLKLSKVVCIATPARLGDMRKKDLKELHQRVKATLSEATPGTGDSAHA